MSPLTRCGAWIMAVAAAATGRFAADPELGEAKGVEEPVSRVERMGDSLPDGAVLRIGTRRLRHGDQVNATVFSPDGQTLYSAGRDGVVRVWEMPAGRERYAIRLADGESVDDLILSPDGMRLIGACGGGLIVEWAAADGALLRKTASEQQLTWLAFTPDGRHLLTAGNEGTLFIRDAGTAGIIRPLKAHADALARPVALPDGSRIYTAGEDERLRAWDPATGTLLGTWTDHEEPIRAMAVSGDGRWLVTGDGEGRVFLRDPATARILRRYVWPDDVVGALAFMPGDRHLAVAVNASVHVITVDSGEVVTAIAVEGEAFGSLAFTCDGKTMAAASGSRALVMDLETVPTLLERRIGHDKQDDSLVALGATEDGRRAAGQTLDRGLVLWDLEAGEELRRIDAPADPPMRLAFSSDGACVAGGAEGGRSVTVWDAGSGGLLRQLAWEGSSLASLAFVPGGRRLVVAGTNGWVSLWDAGGGGRIAERKAGGETRDRSLAAVSSDGRTLCLERADHLEMLSLPGLDNARLTAPFEGIVTALVFSPDGGRVAAGCDTGHVYLWAAGSGPPELLAQAPLFEKTITAMAFQADGRLLVATSDDDRVSWALWDPRPADAGAKTCRWDEPAPESGMAVALRDGRILSGPGAGSVLSIRRLGDGIRAMMRARDGFDASFERVRHSSDGSLICASAYDTGRQGRRLFVIDARTGRLTSEPKMEPRELSDWACPSGGGLVTLYQDGRVCLWSLPGGGLVSETAMRRNDILAASFSTDGRQLALSTQRRLICWDVAGRREIRSIEAPVQVHPVALALAGDGTTVIRFRSNLACEVWDLAAGQRLQDWPMPQSGRSDRVMMPDGMSFLLPTVLNEKKGHLLVDIAGRRGAALLPDTLRETNGIAVRRDGTVVATITEEGIALWEPWTGTRLHAYAGITDAVSAMDFSPDGSRLVIACDDATLLVLDTSRWTGDPLQSLPVERVVLKDDWAAMGAEAEDGQAAFRAMARMARRGDEAVRFVADRLTALPAAPDRLPRWLRELDDDTVEIRERAMAEMKGLGPEHEASLRTARDRAPSAEVANRLDRILADLAARPMSEEAVRRVRAMRVLGRIGTPAARSVLAGAAEGALYREEARAARLAIALLDACRP